MTNVTYGRKKLVESYAENEYEIIYSLQTFCNTHVIKKYQDNDKKSRGKQHKN